MFNVNEDETVSVLVTGRNTRSRVTLTVRTPGTNAVHYHPVSRNVQTGQYKIFIFIFFSNTKKNEDDKRVYLYDIQACAIL